MLFQATIDKALVTTKKELPSVVLTGWHLKFSKDRMTNEVTFGVSVV